MQASYEAEFKYKMQKNEHGIQEDNQHPHKHWEKETLGGGWGVVSQIWRAFLRFWFFNN